MISTITAAALLLAARLGTLNAGAEVPLRVASGVGQNDPERLRRRG